MRIDGIDTSSSGNCSNRAVGIKFVSLRDVSHSLVLFPGWLSPLLLPARFMEFGRQEVCWVSLPVRRSRCTSSGWERDVGEKLLRMWCRGFPPQVLYYNRPNYDSTGKIKLTVDLLSEYQ
jgi:hypothetical protein